MSKRDLNPQPAAVIGETGGKTVKLYSWLTFGVPGHLDLPPADCPGPPKRLHRFVDRLLSRDAGSGMPGGIGAGGQIIPFPFREKAGHGLLPLTGQQRSHPLQVNQVYPNPDDRHRRDHQNSASGRSGGGTGKYPPSTRPT